MSFSLMVLAGFLGRNYYFIIIIKQCLIKILNKIVLNKLSVQPVQVYCLVYFVNKITVPIANVSVPCVRSWETREAAGSVGPFFLLGPAVIAG